MDSVGLLVFLGAIIFLVFIIIVVAVISSISGSSAGVLDTGEPPEEDPYQGA